MFFYHDKLISYNGILQDGKSKYDCIYENNIYFYIKQFIQPILINKISYFGKAVNINEILKDYKDKMIKQLSQNIAEQLCAQQVITSLPDCIKQLVDNAIDADATYIKIILQEYGKSKVQVIDNGFGIDNFDFLGKKGSTSKNKGTDQFNYLGFRGEAIHSIARVSAAMTIESKCSVDGFRRQFDCCSNKLEIFKQERLCHGQFNFQILNKQSSRSTGTKVTINELFKNLPVRQKQLQEKYKSFLQKTNQLIKQFCLVYPQIQFIFINTRERKQEIIIETNALKTFSRTSWLERIKQIDQKLGNSLIYITGEYFKGFVLNNIQSGSSRNNNFIRKVCHYLYLNRRPINVVPSIQATFNEMYKKYNSTAKYAFLINLELDHTKIDVNLTPNKRQIFIRKEILEKIIKQLKEQISQKVVEDIPSLNNFQDKKKGNQNDVITYSQPSIIDHLSKSGIPIERKTISFPINRREQDNSHPNHLQPSNQQKSIFIRDNPNGKSTFFTPQSNGQSDQKKQIIINKPTKTLVDLPQLPKINLDMNKLKQRLNSRLSGNFGGLKRISNESENPFNRPTSSKEVHHVEMTDQRQLDDFRKENQQKKVRQEEEDARKRANFLKQVKIEYAEEDHKKLKPVIEKYNMSTTSKNREFKSKENIIEQQLRRKQVDDDGQSYYHPQKIDSYSQIQHQNSSFKSKSIEASDKNLEERIKAKLTIDMSQIFTKFNQSKSGNPIKNDTNNHSNHEEVRILQTIDIEEQKKETTNSNQIQIQQKIENICENVVQSILIMDGKGKQTTKSLKKQNFRQFQIIGQFNLGFILCVFNHEYFLVDQHAASQKHYYQQFLSKNYRLQSIRADDRQNITGIQADQIDQCRQLLNEAGFLYQIIDRCMLQLQKCPVFFEMKLGLQYFWQIVEQKKDLNRVPKFTAMCAMKACKTAIVVGNALRYSEMKQVVHNLSNLESPWNCPHGRPTLVQLGKRQVFRGRVKKIKKTHQYQF